MALVSYRPNLPFRLRKRERSIFWVGLSAPPDTASVEPNLTGILVIGGEFRKSSGSNRHVRTFNIRCRICGDSPLQEGIFDTLLHSSVLAVPPPMSQPYNAPSARKK